MHKYKSEEHTPGPNVLHDNASNARAQAEPEYKPKHGRKWPVIFAAGLVIFGAYELGVHNSKIEKIVRPVENAWQKLPQGEQKHTAERVAREKHVYIVKHVVVEAQPHMSYRQQMEKQYESQLRRNEAKQAAVNAGEAAQHAAYRAQMARQYAANVENNAALQAWRNERSAANSMAYRMQNQMQYEQMRGINYMRQSINNMYNNAGNYTYSYRR